MAVHAFEITQINLFLDTIEAFNKVIGILTNKYIYNKIADVM